MIDTRRSCPCLHTRESSLQIAGRVHLIDQAEPLSSPDSVFQSRQHPFRPHRRFRPFPSSPNVSHLFSRFRHCRGSLFRRLCHHVSISLSVLRSMSITTILRYYSLSASCPPTPLRASSFPDRSP